MPFYYLDYGYFLSWSKERKKLSKSQIFLEVIFFFQQQEGRRGHVSDLQLPMQPVPITTKVVSSNTVHGEVYSIQHYAIKFVSDLRQVDGFFSGNPVSQITLTATIYLNIVESGKIKTKPTNGEMKFQNNGLQLRSLGKLNM